MFREVCRQPLGTRANIPGISAQQASLNPSAGTLSQPNRATFFCTTPRLKIPRDRHSRHPELLHGFAQRTTPPSTRSSPRLFDRGYGKLSWRPPKPTRTRGDWAPEYALVLQSESPRLVTQLDATTPYAPGAEARVQLLSIERELWVFAIRTTSGYHQRRRQAHRRPIRTSHGPTTRV